MRNCSVTDSRKNEIKCQNEVKFKISWPLSLTLKKRFIIVNSKIDVVYFECCLSEPNTSLQISGNVDMQFL